VTDSVTQQLEADLIELSQHLTKPGERECLRCFLMRMISEFGCDGTYRWTIRWRGECAPRARGLIGRMQQCGACCCDCEVAFTMFPGYPQVSQLLPCTGVPRPGSAMPCDLRLQRKSA
jgi:hypothetical protein